MSTSRLHTYFPRLARNQTHNCLVVITHLWINLPYCLAITLDNDLTSTEFHDVGRGYGWGVSLSVHKERARSPSRRRVHFPTGYEHAGGGMYRLHSIHPYLTGVIGRAATDKCV
jgi:hypothetical protein